MSFTKTAIKWGAGLSVAAVVAFGGVKIEAAELSDAPEANPEAQPVVEKPSTVACNKAGGLKCATL